MIAFALANWRWLLPTLGIVAALAWGGWQHLGKLEAEKVLVDQKLKQEQDANATWIELNRKREAFESEVRKGLDRLNDDVAAIHATTQQYRARVNANANSNRSLDPAELDALGLLAGGANGDKAGGRAVRPAIPSAPVR